MCQLSKILSCPLLLIVVILTCSGQLSAAGEITFDTTTITINDKPYDLEIARMVDQRQRGLMFRQTLNSRQGMVFVYPNSARHRIWMKNTRIQLTVIWADTAGQVLSVQTLHPCLKDPCISYGADQPSRYIIELNHEAHDIKVGDIIPGLNKLQATPGFSGS